MDVLMCVKIIKETPLTKSGNQKNKTGWLQSEGQTTNQNSGSWTNIHRITCLWTDTIWETYNQSELKALHEARPILDKRLWSGG